MAIKKNDRVELTIDGWGPNGLGKGTVQDMDVFVPYAAVGDHMLVHITKVVRHPKQSYAYGKCIELNKRSEMRQTAPCPVFGKCGGCQLQHLQYANQLDYKVSVFQSIVKSYGLTLPEPTVHGVTQSLYYRHRAQFAIRRNEEGQLIIGLSAPRSQRIIPIQHCMIQSKGINKILEALYSYLHSSRIPIFDSNQSISGLANVLIRYSEEEEGGLVVFSGDHPNPFDQTDLDTLEKIPGILGCFYSQHKQVEWEVLGDTLQLLFGKSTINEVISGCRLQLNVRSFFQANLGHIPVLWQCIRAALSPTKGMRVLELYCGSGGISLAMAPYCAHVHGIELDPEAIDLAEQNANANHLKNLSFQCGDVLDGLGDACAYDAVVVDPSRKGLSVDVVDALREHQIPRLVYISCQPATLARDLDRLMPMYRVSSVDLLDMFPQTHHMELVIGLVLEH